LLLFFRKEESSFSEEKEAKRRLLLVLFHDACRARRWAMRRREYLQFSAASAFVAAPAPTVRLITTFGPILVACDAVHAPISANAFLACVAAHGYDGGTFTRVVRPDNDHGHPIISVVQGAARAGAPAPAIAHESTRQTGLKHLDGTVSLPRDAVGSATGAEIFICVGDQPGLDFGARRNPDGQGFAAFGRVTSGMDIVRRIRAMDPSGPSPDTYTKGQILRTPVPILAATRLP
jgi:peptidyl-prolyl cis-trans isomerase A (cyclophilin A)